MLVDFLASGWKRTSIMLAPLVFCCGLFATISPRGGVRLGKGALQAFVFHHPQ